MAPLSKPGLPEEVARNLPISDASRPCWRVTSGNAFFGIAKVTSADIALRPDGDHNRRIRVRVSELEQGFSRDSESND